MKTVRVKCNDLLNHLVKNREKHIDEHNNMMKIYRLAVVDRLNKMLSLAKEDKDVPFFDLVNPESYLSSYDQAIEMLQWTTDTEILLEAGEFRQYVMDEWGWKHSFKGTETFYNEVATSFSAR